MNDRSPQSPGPWDSQLEKRALRGLFGGLLGEFLSLPPRVLRWAFPLVTAIVATVLGCLYGVQLVVLTLAGGALLLVIMLVWGSVQALAGESELSFEEAFSMGARSAEEEQKRAVLRALKDLEYERSVGKISDEDYQEYATRYRAEAKRLIRNMDESMAEARKRVEQDLAKRLDKLAPEPEEDDDASDEPVIAPAEKVVEAKSNPEHAPPVAEKSAKKALRECNACHTKNELDARFCKSCGAPMAAAGEQLCAHCPARYPETESKCPECGTEKGADA